MAKMKWTRYKSPVGTEHHAARYRIFPSTGFPWKVQYERKIVFYADTLKEAKSWVEERCTHTALDDADDPRR